MFLIYTFRVIKTYLEMMKLKTILVDDEIFNLKNLEFILNNNFPEVEIVGLFRNVLDAKEYIENNSVDLLLLDISMPEENGFDLLKYFPVRNFQVVFVTAHEEFAINAIRVGAIDYILKPILISELKVAVESVKKRLFDSGKAEMLHKISLSYDGGKSIIDFSEILYIKGDDNISTIYLEKKRNITISKTLKYFEQELNDRFIRIHKSYLINLKFARKIIAKEVYQIELEDGTQLPISRRNIGKVNDVFNKL